MRNRSPRVSRLEADWTRQVLMTSDQWDRYTLRVAELKGTLRDTEVRPYDGGWIVYSGHPDGIDDGPFPTRAEAYAYSRRMATRLGRGLPIAEARMQAEREVTSK